MNSRKITDMHNFWNEENRLQAASCNGYVSSYLYDADGNRTVKLSAPYEAVYTNSAEATPPSDTLRYTLYVGPHYTVTGTTGSEDVEPRYVKHFFIGNKRVASKIANAPGYDPRGITTVAGKSIYVKVDYPVKYGEQKAQVSGNYTNFAMPYSNIDMNNYDYPFNRPGYWNGCVPPNNTGTVVVMGNRDSESEETDSIGEPEQRTSPVENLSFFYHTDHLGSTNLVTGRGTTLCHATEYLPYGEEFVDLMASGSDPELPFKFNGKELDSETGLLYYGARYYMPKYYQWPTCDPMELKYPGVSSYSFCHNNPLNRIDLLGLYDTEAEAAKAASSYHAQYYQDRQSGKWFVALNEYGNGAYTSGGTMTRDFGLKDNLTIKGRYDNGSSYIGLLGFDAAGFGTSMMSIESDVLKANKSTFRLFNSKGFFDPHLYRNGWRGNRFLKTTRLASVGKALGKANNIMSAVFVSNSIEKGFKANSFEESIENYSDALYGGIGMLPGGYPLSLYWSLGGKEASKIEAIRQMDYGIIGLPGVLPYK